MGTVKLAVSQSRDHLSQATLRAISKTLADAIEGNCSCLIAPDGQGYLGHSTCCGVHFSREHYRRTARFLAEEFRKRDMAFHEEQWAGEEQRD